MKTLFTTVFALILAAGGTLSAQTTDDRVIVSSNEWTITAQQFENILKSLPEQARNYFANSENRRQFLDDLIEMWILASEARTKGVDKQPELKAEVEFYSNNIIAREYSRQLGDSKPITDAEVETFYKSNENDYSEVKVAHILVVNSDNPEVKAANIEGALPQAEARKKIEEIKAKMRAGEKFEDLAKEHSQDSASARNGGDIGFIKKGQLVGDVDKAAFALVPGGFSDIIESPIGFHILHVTERKVTPFDEVRDEIKQRMTKENRESQVQTRMKALGVKIDETFFKKQ